jgi:hypothetical protein
MKPTIHLNGTNGHVLLEQTTDVMNKVTVALNALRAAAPNGRDYYTQGPGAIDAATAEHNARVDKLLDVLRELNEIALSICDQNDARRSR